MVKVKSPLLEMCQCIENIVYILIYRYKYCIGTLDIGFFPI